MNFKQKRHFKQSLTGACFLGFVIVGIKYPIIGFFIPLCMLFGIALSLKFGRKWCDWMCPRGSFFERYGKILSGKKETPTLFKSFSFRFLIMAILFVTLGFIISNKGFTLDGIGRSFYITMLSTTAIGILFTLMWNERAWCFICPVGTIGAFFSRDKKYTCIDQTKCVQCKGCVTVCPMHLSVYDNNSPKQDCLRCKLCKDFCKYDAIKYN